MFVFRTARDRAWRMLMAATVVAALGALLVATSSAGAASIVGTSKNRPAVVIGDATITEGNAGTATLSFQVRLSAPAKELGSVSFATADATATARGDYQAASGTIRFKRGEEQD